RGGFGAARIPAPRRIGRRGAGRPPVLPPADDGAGRRSAARAAAATGGTLPGGAPETDQGPASAAPDASPPSRWAWPHDTSWRAARAGRSNEPCTLAESGAKASARPSSKRGTPARRPRRVAPVRVQLERVPPAAASTAKNA